jgi:cell division septation protein DedD
MMKKMKKTQKQIFLCLIAFLAFGIVQFANIVSANNTPQTLPFSQNWSNVNLITTNDDWSGVPGIVGYRGDELVTATGADPRTILNDGSASPVDVNANQTNPDTSTTGGVSEFEIADPVVALQGSGTADAPHLVIYLNTTGQSNINFRANIRDIDGSADDAIQQVDVQYRVGGTGNYTSVPGGYIADATTGGSATQVTPLNLTLPSDANNQSLVEIRVITTNAIGSDEWVGVDDITITAGGGGMTPTPTTPTPTTPTPTTPTPTTPTPTTPTPTTPTPTTPGDANIDMDGDGKSDYVVTRNANSLKTWWVSINGSNATSDGQFGLASDVMTPEDFDGDKKDDLAVWRSGAPFQAAFYIYQSSNNTVRTEIFGQTGDNPTVVGDYDSDGKADPAVYRPAAAGQQSYFFYKGSLNNPNGITTFVPWGSGNMRPYNGDFDGDDKNDFCLFTTVNGRGQFLLLKSNGFGVEYIDWGSPSDTLVPGDYDGDKRSDFAVVRAQGGQHAWYILERDGGGTGASPILWGLTTDSLAPGDYDGDAKQDVAVWRGNADPSMNYFYIRRSSDSALQFFEWGQQGDVPAAGWYVSAP